MCKFKRLVPLALALTLLAGCGQGAASPEPEEEIIGADTVAIEIEDGIFVDPPVQFEEIEIESEAVALAASPIAISNMLTPEASGTSVEKNARVTIDYSNIKDGYVMVKFTGTTKTRIKVKVIGPTTEYCYDLPVGDWVTFPLSDGNGSYQVKVLENTTGNKYAVVLSTKFTVTLSDEFAPFLRPNQYVDYEIAEDTIAKAEELAGKLTDPLDKVKAIYEYVVTNFTYDTKKASTVKSGYLPVLDDVLEAKKGICFDYAALMTGMLRSQGVPCKLVVGYAGTAYHAWVSVWTEESGWIDAAVYFDGTAWHRMDPTFASSSNRSKSIMKYIGDGSNYTVKYLY